MKTRIYIIILFSIGFFLFSCKSDKKYKPENLRELTNIELREKAINKTLFQLDDAIYKNESGLVISKDSIKKLNTKSWFLERYVDNNGKIKELIIRKATEKDIAFKEELISLFQKTPIQVSNIDCSKQEEILSEIYKLDQEMRSGNNIFDPEIDIQNLITIKNLIKKCGMPTLEEVNSKQMSAIWLVFQHADNDIRKEYFPLLKQAAKNGDIKKSAIALMEDRILMYDRKPQIYGSQVIKDNKTDKWKLYNLENKETVDRRRKEVGLNPLSEYLKRWDIEFKVKQVK
ncbi:DUF6624 domain-containing protein [Mesonia mobilis]|uniref:Lipoprotein n=1 Tax=Mesonia mobilis TaxID=369791 RepID=A0ABQ3C5F3_9FLAO|nr:DUF6624 domain-containing protein [Mesonia mobilis]MBQ0739639.1 hypothetical protein [Aquimarina celericrescens]GGZ65577.1 hypothetical protein GCM10008088_28530 [Mesonia mobilis]